MSRRDIHEQLQDGQLQTILATIPVGVIIVDAEGRIISANARAEEIWGGELPTEADVGAYERYRGWWPESGEPLAPGDWAVARALAKGEAISSEMIDIERFDGCRATMLTSAAPLRDRHGNITGAVVAMHDVTGQRERQRTNELLLEALSALAGSLELSEVLDRLVRVLFEMGGHTRAAVFLWDENNRELELAAAMGEPLPQIGTRLPLVKYSAEMQRAVEQKSRVIADFTALPEQAQGLAAYWGIATALIVPLVRGGNVLGVMSVDDMRPGVSFTDREVTLVEGIASSAGLAIENARLYEAEHHIADTLQRSLLAVPDSMSRISFAHAYRSASEAAFVGGDFYDLFEIDHDLVGILIGDVAGKGLEAAVLTQLVKNTVRAHAAEKGNSPATVMALTSSIFYQTTTPDMFATAFFGVLNRASGRLAYTNAGHTSGFILSAGQARALPADSPLLGAFADRTFEQSEAWLEPRDLLVLYTDGITEARSGGRQYGEERLLQAIELATGSDPPMLVRAIIDDVLAFTGGGLQDDLALLVVERLEDRATSPLQQKLEVTAI